MDLSQFSNQQLFLASFLVLLLCYYLLFFRFWLRAMLSGVHLSQSEIIFMRLRRTPVDLIISELIKAAKSGVSVTRDQLEVIHLSGGNVSNVVAGLIYAKSREISLSFSEASKLDQQKLDLVEHLKKTNPL
jgi:uncharacterized protein YqfA (UPF0365 family)